MSKNNLKNWNQIDISKYIGEYKNGELTEYKQTIKRCIKFQGKYLVKLNDSGLKHLIKKELKLDKDHPDFQSILNCLKQLISNNKSNKLSKSKKNDKKISKSQKKKKSKIRKTQSIKKLKINSKNLSKPPISQSVSYSPGIDQLSISSNFSNTSVLTDNTNQDSIDDGVKPLTLEDIYNNKEYQRLVQENGELKLKNEILNNQITKLTTTNTELVKDNITLNKKLETNHKDTINWIMGLNQEDFLKYKNIFDYKFKLLNYKDPDIKTTPNINDDNISINSNNVKNDISTISDENDSKQESFMLIQENYLNKLNKIETENKNITNNDITEIDKPIVSTINIDKNNNKKDKISSNINETKKNNDSFWDIPDLGKKNKPKAPIGSCVSRR